MFCIAVYIVTCCFEAKNCGGQKCCWGNSDPYDKFLMRVKEAVGAEQTVEVVDLERAGLGDGVLNSWGCDKRPGGGEMHRPVQVEIGLAAFV